MSGHNHRLRKLEAELGADPSVAGRRCRDCGGLNICDALNAHHVIEQGMDCGEKMTPDCAEAVLAALDAGTARCEQCGAGTLAGALAELPTVPDDPE